MARATSETANTFGRVVEDTAQRVVPTSSRATTERALHNPLGRPEGVADGSKIARFIFELMIANQKDQEFFRIKHQLELWAEASSKGDSSTSESSIGYLVGALLMFKDQVGYGKPWDKKHFIEKVWGREATLFGRLVGHDVWSNMLYGWLGRKLGFSAELLLDAAGLAQWKYAKVDPVWLKAYKKGPMLNFRALDDPIDQEAIKLGMEFADSPGEKDFSMFLKLLRENVNRLGRGAVKPSPEIILK